MTAKSVQMYKNYIVYAFIRDIIQVNLAKKFAYLVKLGKPQHLLVILAKNVLMANLLLSLEVNVRSVLKTLKILIINSIVNLLYSQEKVNFTIYQ